MKLLKAFPSHFVLLADYGDVPGIITENYAFTSLGKLNHDSIAHILLNFCITESIDTIIPLHSFEIEPIAKSAVLFSEYGIEVLLPHFELLNQYIDAEQNKNSELYIFVKGECVFSTNKDVPQNSATGLNGVFTLDNLLNYKLFTI
ncbi:ATP-grasp domain-containing protein [Pedobacter jejuensis]|uniref:Uncharacterized protein n=1 Tax=Pedobacter jejuensis TaxID=1268550 RepID=A0A3N0C0H3_9SPHI|nr:hypothetical protein [Pedobacter jejuensis]RNL55687.1 hypothetical protein D7004_02705 [Pedobacter jejuensis]